MSRYRAALYHLSISLVVFAVLAYIVLFVWFPDFFYSIDGGWEGMRIIIGVDLVLGPTLTLIVFKTGKPGLKLDLTLIGSFQSICLLAGLYIIYSERPLFFIYYDQHFYSSSADTFTDYGVRVPDLDKFDGRLPKRVFVKLPENPIEEADFRRVLYQDRIPAWVYGPLFVPLDQHMEDVLAGATSLDELRERDREDNLSSWLAKYGGDAEDYAFIPVHSRYRDAFIGIERETSRFVDIVEIPPPM